MKELEARGIVERHVSDCTPTKVSYELTAKGSSWRPRWPSSRAGRTAGWTDFDQTSTRDRRRSMSLHAVMR